MKPVHPGRILRREMVKARGLSGNKLALALRVPSGRVTAILNGKEVGARVAAEVERAA